MRALVLLLASGCAFERGEPTGVVAASFRADYALAPERDAGDGWQSLVGPSEVRLDSAVMGLDAIELVEVVGPDDAPSESTVATLSAGADADLLSSAELDLVCAGSCVVPPGRLVRAVIPVASLHVSG